MVQEADQEIADTQAALASAAKLTGLEQATDVNPAHQTLEMDLDKQRAELDGIQSRRDTIARQSWMNRQQLAKLGDATSTFDDLFYAKKTE
jgi:hypothetical protein